MGWGSGGVHVGLGGWDGVKWCGAGRGGAGWARGWVRGLGRIGLGT